MRPKHYLQQSQSAITEDEFYGQIDDDKKISDSLNIKIYGKLFFSALNIKLTVFSY